MKVRYMQPHRPSYGQSLARSACEEIIGVFPDSPREFDTLAQANEYARDVYGPEAFCVEVEEPRTPHPHNGRCESIKSGGACDCETKAWYKLKIESEKGMEIGAGTLKPQEDLADRLGQIIFRIETNFYGFSASNPKSQEERNLAILADIEKLKELKKELES